MQQFDKNFRQLSIENCLPHNFLAEKFILSSLLISTEAIDIALNNLTVQTFYFKNHQEIYKAIIIIYEKTKTIDLITLSTFLNDNGLLEEIGGIKVLTELILEVPSLEYLEEYIRLLQDKFIRRTLIKLGYGIVNSSYITNIPLENIFNELETQIFTLKNQTQDKESLNSIDIFSNVFFELKKKNIKPFINWNKLWFLRFRFYDSRFPKIGSNYYSRSSFNGKNRFFIEYCN